MHVAQVERDGFQRAVNLLGHEVEMVDVGRQAEVGIRAALVGCEYELAVLYLKLHQAEAWRLIALRVCGSKKEYRFYKN